MLHTDAAYPADKRELYAALRTQLAALIEGERHPMPNLANAAALLGGALPGINWVGFYLMADGGLLLGPFWGKPACIRIPVGRGVCGSAVAQARTLRVDDVHAFAGHIACDCASNSEIVAPLFADGRVVGVLDVDSPRFARFDGDDQAGLEALAKLLADGCEWSAMALRDPSSSAAPPPAARRPRRYARPGATPAPPRGR